MLDRRDAAGGPGGLRPLGRGVVAAEAWQDDVKTDARDSHPKVVGHGRQDE